MEENGPTDAERILWLEQELKSVFRLNVNLSARTHDLEMLLVEMSGSSEQFATLLAESLLARDRHKTDMAKTIVSQHVEKLNEINAPELVKGNHETDLQRLQWHQQSLESADAAGHLQDWISTTTYNQRLFIFNASCGFVSDGYLDDNDGMGLVFYWSAPDDREFGRSNG